MDKTEMAKKIAELIVSIGVGAVVGNAIKIGTPSDIKLIGKIGIGIGGFVLSNMTGDFAASYIRKQIDEVIEQFNLAKDAVTLVVQEQEQ